MAVDTQGKSAWTGKDVSEREINLLNQRVIQFTDIEDTFLDVWLQLENANLDELAAKVINAGLLFEHYLSQLPNDPTQRSPEEIAQLETYRSDAGSALDEGRAALASAILRKFLKTSAPLGVWYTSGWNCTPNMFIFSCLIA